MKNLLQTLFFFLLGTQICFGQWYQQNSGTIQNLNNLQFVDANTGWAVGHSGTILHTTDGGNNWISQGDTTYPPLSAVYFTDSNTGWAVGGIVDPFGGPGPNNGNWGLIFKTTNGGNNWISHSDTIPYSLCSVYFTDANTGWAVGGVHYLIGGQPSVGIVLKTTDGGINWTSPIIYFEGPCYSVYFTDSYIGWIVGEFGVLHTIDGGTNWASQSSAGWLNSIYLLDSNTGWVVGAHINYGPYELILKTTNGGTNWILQSNGTNEGCLNSVYFLDSNTGWAVGSESGWGGGTGVILKTTDGGSNWISQTSISSLSSVYFTDANTGWAVGENGTILHTTNGGVPVELTSFTATSNGEEVILCWTTATETNNSGFEILRFTQNDNEWNTIGFVPGFGTTTEPKSYSYTDKKLSAGKYTYRLKQIDFDGSYEYSQEIEVEVFAPLTFSLEQNYPNPFNPSTVIIYHLPVSGDVILKVFDVLGNEIATLIDEYKLAGRCEVEFNASSLPSGVYFYQLNAGDFVSTKKMILLR